ncbi:ATP-dependent DNA helicase PIF1-like [Macrosteles quadrilineatus]|nr:ATP-dependent DNA helicase PIF1-like [Macrosteles quadrilineatus]
MGAPAALLWDAFRDSICEDHIERNPLDVELAYKLGLIDIDRSLRRQGSCVADHGLPDVHDDTTELGRELLLHGENQQRVFVEEWVPKLSEDQNRVFEYVTSVLNAPASGTSSKIIFLDGPGGYGKTTLIRVILAYVRGCRQVALAVASSGIAAGNMPGGTTAHSMFRLPLDFGDGTGFWNITNGSQRAELIRAARLIVFDEAPMAHRFVFEVLDRSLRDLMRSSELFGGKIFLCCGDFRQIAPVVVNARTPTDIVCVSLRASHLWQHFKIFALTTAHRTSSSTAYSEFLLRVGNGTVSSTTFLEGRNEQSLIPLLGIRQVTSLTDLVDSVFPANVLLDSDMCSRRAILSTLIVNVKEINDHILNSLDGHLYELRSADTVDRENDDGLDVDVQLLNTATGKGVPDHVLRLKIGSVCLIMRNLNIAEGLVNGTKVIVIGITNRLITVRLPGQTQPIGIPRITFTFAFVEGSPLRVRRRQFPLMLAYCMTGHKSQGQTIDSVGVDLRTDCFTHGQLYVLLSRVRHPDHIVVLVHPERVRDGIAYAKNIVYGDLLL